MAETDLRVSGSRAGSFLLDQWLEGEGGRAPSAESLRQGVSCDAWACRLSGPSGERVAHVIDASAFVEDCRRAAILITPLPAPRNCAASLVIDGSRLARSGAQAVSLPRKAAAGSAAALIATAWPARQRPWHQPLPPPDQR